MLENNVLNGGLDAKNELEGLEAVGKIFISNKFLSIACGVLIDI